MRPNMPHADEHAQVMDADMEQERDYKPEELQYGVSEFLKAFGYEPATDTDMMVVGEIIEGADANELAAQYGGDPEEKQRRMEIDQQTMGMEDYPDDIRADETEPSRMGSVDRYRYGPENDDRMAMPEINADRRDRRAEDPMPGDDELWRRAGMEGSRRKQREAQRRPYKVIPRGMAEDDMPPTNQYDYIREPEDRGGGPEGMLERLLRKLGAL